MALPRKFGKNYLKSKLLKEPSNCCLLRFSHDLIFKYWCFIRNDVNNCKQHRHFAYNL